MVKREVHGSGVFKNTAVLKDKNFLKLKKSEKCIVFSDEDIQAITRQMAYDIILLSQFNLMDYSLLFVIEYNPRYAQEYPYLYKRSEFNDLVYPLEPTKEHMR